jgi:hypothetical protein
MEPLARGGEELCAVGQALALVLDDYERSGGRDLTVDVLGVAPYAELFCAEESLGHLDRPEARCVIVLRAEDQRESVIGVAGAGRGWYVERLRQLGASVALGATHRVAVDVAGPEGDLEHPGRDYAWDHKTGHIQANRMMRLASAGLWAKDRASKKKNPDRNPARNPEWLPDPSRRHSLRFWDGARWTRFVVERVPRPD